MFELSITLKLKSFVRHSFINDDLQCSSAQQIYLVSGESWGPAEDSLGAKWIKTHGLLHLDCGEVEPILFTGIYSMVDFFQAQGAPCVEL